MKKIISVFLNPAIDLTLWVKGSSDGEPYIVESKEAYAAGKGVNVSKTLSAVGCENLALGVIGKSNRDKFMALLEKENIEFDITEFDGETRENITVCFSDGKILKINHKGLLEDKKCISHFKEKLKKHSKNAEFVVFGGKIPEGISKEEYIEIISLSGDAKVIVDTSSFSLEDYKKLRLFAIKPNHKELSEITGLPTETDEEAVSAAKKLLPFIENVIVSRGEKGIILVKKDAAVKASLPKTEILSDIGAGDSALAGFIYAVGMGLPLEETAAYASAFGTAKTLVEGTGTPSKKTIDELYSKVVIKRIEMR